MVRHPVCKASFSGAEVHLLICPGAPWSLRVVLPFATGGGQRACLTVDYAMKPVCLRARARNLPYSPKRIRLRHRGDPALGTGPRAAPEAALETFHWPRVTARNDRPAVLASA